MGIKGTAQSPVEEKRFFAIGGHGEPNRRKFSVYPVNLYLHNIGRPLPAYHKPLVTVGVEIEDRLCKSNRRSPKRRQELVSEPERSGLRENDSRPCMAPPAG